MRWPKLTERLKEKDYLASFILSLPRTNLTGAIAALAQVLGRGCFLSFAIRFRLHPCCHCILLSHHEPSNLQELVGLLAGKLICILKSLQAPCCALCGRLQYFKRFSIRSKGVLLFVQTTKKGIVGFF